MPKQASKRYEYRRAPVKKDNRRYLFAIALSLFVVVLFFAIKESQITGATTDGRIEAHQIVIGVEINGSAKAYPLYSFDVVNDNVGGVSIVVTHDGAFERKVGDRYLEFSFVNGNVIDSNGKIWTKGQSSYGTLKSVRFEKTPWYSWLAWHKDTEIYNMIR